MLYQTSPTVGLIGALAAVVVLTPPPIILPPTFKFPLIPTPPSTRTAPVFVPVDSMPPVTLSPGPGPVLANIVDTPTVPVLGPPGVRLSWKRVGLNTAGT